MRIFSFFHSLFCQKKPGNEKVDFCIFGLGNPGNQYRYNRHNIGFRVLDSFNSHLTNIKKYTCCNSEIETGTLSGNQTVAVVKPLTFMNNSGVAVEAVLKQFGSGDCKFIVIADDFNLPIGAIRIRRGGSHGGHNGLKSIIACIGPDFSRLRIGIGPLPEKLSVIDFVLGNFNAAEEKIIESVITKVHDVLKLFTVQSIDTVMNKYN
jgi:PTH1 family peptidyl-tRNA hydrolase